MTDTGLPAEVVALLREGRKVAAIRQLRERTGLDLSAAKSAVEAHIAADPVLRERAAEAARGGQGCGLVLFLITLAIVCAWLYVD